MHKILPGQQQNTSQTQRQASRDMTPQTRLQFTRLQGALCLQSLYLRLSVAQLPQHLRRVLAAPWRAAAGPRRRALQPRRRRRLTRSVETLPRSRLRALRRFRHTQHRRDAGVLVGETAHPLGLRARPERRRHASARRRVVVRELLQVREVQKLGEAREELRFQRADGHVAAVGGGVAAVPEGTAVQPAVAEMSKVSSVGEARDPWRLRGCDGSAGTGGGEESVVVVESITKGRSEGSQASAGGGVDGQQQRQRRGEGVRSW